MNPNYSDVYDHGQEVTVLDSPTLRSNENSDRLIRLIGQVGKVISGHPKGYFSPRTQEGVYVEFLMDDLPDKIAETFNVAKRRIHSTQIFVPFESLKKVGPDKAGDGWSGEDLYDRVRELDPELAEQVDAYITKYPDVPKNRAVLVLLWIAVNDAASTGVEYSYLYWTNFWEDGNATNLRSLQNRA